MKNTLLISFLLLATVFGCKKKEGAPPPPTQAQILSQQAWKFDRAGLDADKNGTIDTDAPPGYLQPCLLDNTVLFSASGSGTVDESTLKCGTAQTIPFTWSFADNETTMVINGSVIAGVGGRFKILELNATSLRLSKDTTAPGFPLPLTLVAQFKH